MRDSSSRSALSAAFHVPFGSVQYSAASCDLSVKTLVCPPRACEVRGCGETPASPPEAATNCVPVSWAQALPGQGSQHPLPREKTPPKCQSLGDLYYLGIGQGTLTLSCWKSGCMETWAWAPICRTPSTPSTPSTTSPVHSERIEAIVVPSRCPGSAASRVNGAGCGQEQLRAPKRPLFIGQAWPVPRPKDSPLQARDAGGRVPRASCSLIPHRAAYARGSHRAGLGPTAQGAEGGG